MEILSETAFWGEHIFLLIIFGVITLITGSIAVALIVAIVSGHGGELGDYIGTLIMSVFCALSIAIFIAGIKQGPDVEYTAIVTDYNEVYEQGYEVKKVDGKLVILTKESR